MIGLQSCTHLKKVNFKKQHRTRDLHRFAFCLLCFWAVNFWNFNNIILNIWVVQAVLPEAVPDQVVEIVDIVLRVVAIE